MRSKAARLLVLLAGVSVAASGCAESPALPPPVSGTTGLDGASIVVGSKDFNEQLVLGQIAVQALENAGAEVGDQTGLEGTENIRHALTSGAIDLYWEYTGTGWVVHLGNDAAEAPLGSAGLAEAVRTADVANGVVWLEPAVADNAYAIATSAARSESLAVTTLSDLADLVEATPEDASLCASPEFLDRGDGWPGIEEAYGFELSDASISEVDVSSVYDRLTDVDECSFGEVFGTDGRILADNLVLLRDDRGFLLNYNIAMTIRRETYEQYGAALEAVFDPITELLTNEKMIELNAQVDLDGEDPADVAAAFLEESALLTP